MLRHDKWLCMMFPRIALLKELLSDDGYLWLSIDDVEQCSARMLLSEFFGEDGFVAQFVWKSRKSEDARDKTGASTDHEYIICFRNSREARLRGSQVNTAKFSNPDNDPRGDWRSADMTGLATKEQRPNLHYDLVNTVTGINYGCPNKGWRFDPQTMQGKIDEERIIWPSSDDGRPRQKLFYNDLKSKHKNISTVITSITTSDGTKELNKIFPESLFDFPKPTDLITFILEQSTDENSIVLDSFSGSGTTGHAVMKMNEQDSGARKFILIECEDYADRLTAERIRRVINGYPYQGTQKEDIFKEKLTWTRFQKAQETMQKVAGLEALHEGHFDRIKKEIKDGELVVYGEKAIEETMPGLGGSFTYCTLGEPFDMDALLNGENLPAYAALGGWVFHTATGEALPEGQAVPEEFYLGESSAYHVWLIYKPDLDFLKSGDSALTLSRAEKISKAKTDGKKHLVFAPAKFVPNKALLDKRVEFAQLPYALYRREQA